MTPRRKRSRKRSAASSTAKLLEDTVFYLDESIYSHALLGAMRAAGARVEHARGAVRADASDEEWLTFVGERGWIALMRDQRIRWRRLERESLKMAGVGAFVFTGGQATAADTADTIVKKLAKLAAIASSERRPFLYSISLGGTLSKIPL